MYLFQSATLTFKNGVFFKRHTYSLSTVPPQINICKTFDGGESTPVIAETLGGNI